MSTALQSVSGVTLATLAKDIRLEWRSKDAINSMLFFALLVVVVFAFSFDPTAEESREIAGGLIWVAFLFAAVVAVLFGSIEQLSTWTAIATLPVAAWELSLGVWLVVKGFKPAPITAAMAADTPQPAYQDAAV